MHQTHVSCGLFSLKGSVRQSPTEQDAIEKAKNNGNALPPKSIIATFAPGVLFGQAKTYVSVTAVLPGAFSPDLPK